MTDRTRWLEQRFSDFWPAHTKAFSDLLITARRHFDGDLDSLLVMAVIGSRSLPDGGLRGLRYSEFRTGRRREDHAPPVINVQSIADVTGIPRETARRKVARLVERGWLEFRDRGIVASPSAATQLQDLTEATLRYLDTVLSALKLSPGAQAEVPIEPDTEIPARGGNGGRRPA